MKTKLIPIIIIVLAVLITLPTFAMPSGIDSKNHESFEKSYSDSYGYNKGECNRKYVAGEEYFYNEYYDHWNVDLIYDANMITSRKLAIAFVKANYPNCKIKFIKLNKKGWKKILHRKSKGIVYIEKCVSYSSGKNYGYTKKGYYIAYNTNVPKNEKVKSYCIWNPYTNYEDDVVAVADNKMIRSEFSN